MADQGWDVVSTNKVGADPWAVTGVTPLGEQEAPLVSPEQMLTPVEGEPVTPAQMAKAVGERLVGGAKYIAGMEPEKRGSLIGDVVSGAERANVGAAGVFRAIAESAAPVLDPITGKILPENPLRRIASEFDRLGKESEARIKAKAPTEEQDVISSGVSSGIQSLTQSLMALPMALLPGGQPAALTMLSSNTGGNAYQEARNKGLSPQQAIPYAVSQASIEYATEVMPLTKLVSDINQKTGFGKLLMNQIVREVPGEQIATVLQDMNDWATLNPEKSAKEYLEERPNAAAQTLVATIVGVGGNVIVGKALQSVVGEEKAPKEAPKVEPTLEAPEGFEVVSQEPIAPVTPVTPTTEAVAPEITLPVSEPTPEQITGISAAQFEEPPAEVTPVTPEEKLPSEGLRTMVQREQAAGDKFISAVGEQFGLTPEQGILALRRLVKDKVVEIDPVAGDFKLKDGRFWDRDVMLRAAGVTPVTPPTFEELPISEEERQYRAQREQEAKDITKRMEQVEKVTADTSLFIQLRGKLDPKEVNDISPDKTFNLLRKKGGVFLDELVSGGNLNPWLPPQLQMYGNEDAQTASEKEQEAVEFIKEKLRNRDNLTEDAKLELERLNYSLEAIENEIRTETEIDDLRDVLKEIAEREGITDIESIIAGYEEAGLGEPAAETAFELAQETREEALARQEREEATRQAAEEKAIADREREVFQLQPQVQERPAAPSGDLFGARGLAEQPAKKAPEAPPTETGLFAPAEEQKPLKGPELGKLLDSGKFYQDSPEWSSSKNEAGSTDKRRYLVPTPLGNVQVDLNFADRFGSAVYSPTVSETGFRSIITDILGPDGQIRPSIAKDPYKAATQIVQKLQDDYRAEIQKRARRKPTGNKEIDEQNQRQIDAYSKILEEKGQPPVVKPKKPSKEEQAAINRERQAAKKEAAEKPSKKAEPDLEEKKARILEMAERLLTKPGNKVTVTEIEYDGMPYESRATMFEGRLFKSEIDEIRSAFGNAKDITLINEDFRVLTVRLTGKYASDSNAVRIIETVYTPIEPTQEEKPEAQKEQLTQEQIDNAETHAEETGGQVVFQKGDYALIRGYSMLTGDPVYVPTAKTSRAKVDVERFSGNQIPADVRQEMIEFKKQAEEEAANEHKQNPFIVFSNGLAMSEDISPELAGVIRGWKSLLKIDVPIYVSTIEDAKKNRNNFTGPHRRIGSGTLDSRERGSMRRMADDSYYILFEKSTSPTLMLEVIAHEMGHLHERLFYEKAPEAERKAVRAAFDNWLASQKGKTAQDLVSSLRGRATARKVMAPAGQMADDMNSYWRSFGEWYADQVSRWAVSAQAPVTVVEKFFKRLANQLRQFYQKLKNAKYLPDETFVKYLENVSKEPANLSPPKDQAERMIEQEGFAFDEEDTEGMVPARDVVAKPGIEEPKAKKLPPGRSPELTAAANQLKRGEITKAEYDELVNKYKPIPVYAEAMKPATPEQVFDALDTAKREKINPEIAEGTSVGLRLDIPAFNRKGIFVVSIHKKRTPSAAGPVIGYGSVARVRDVTFGLGKETKALEIAAGSAKDVLQTIEGKWVKTNPDEAYKAAQDAIKDPEWVQIGIDPTRHSYFYDRRTTQPIVKADEVIQIGNMLLGKGVVYGNKDDFLFNISADPVTTVTQVREGYDNSRKEQIEELARLARKKSEVIKKVRNYGSDIETQRLLNELEDEIKVLRASSDIREPSTSAEAFLKHARDAMDGTGPFREPVLSPDVFATIQAAYLKTPWILEGLKLSIKAPKEPGRGAGAFFPYERIVRLYSGTTGVEDPVTPRHELMHSMEQMMTRGAKDAVINAWGKALQKAIKKHTDKRSQEYFNKVMEFIENPTESNRQAALKVLPSYELYQYINPSEYWAVNAEKLFNSQLGTAWDRFKKAIRKLFEGLKSVFGFDNTYAVHKIFDQMIKNEPARMGRESLVNYMLAGKADIKFLENVKKVDDLLEKQNVADTPMLATSPVKEGILRAASRSKELFKDMVENPKEIPMMAFNGVDRGLLYLRNKNIWFGSGLNAADFSKYNGELKTGEGLATASLALDNAIRGGNIGIQVIMQGGIKFNDKAKTFGAVKTDKGMRQVYEAEARLKDELGDQRATNLIQRYLEAKRSRSIQNEYYDRQAFLELNKDMLAEMKADPNADPKELRDMERAVKQAEDDLRSIEIVMNKVRMTDEQIDDVVAMDKDYPDLKAILDNFQAVNQNMLRFWRQVGMLSEGRYNTLSAIKDYVPWHRIMDDAEDVHSPLQSTTRTFTNIGKEKIFKAGKPSVVADFIAEQDQQVFDIQPGNVNRVTINGKKVKPNDMTVTSDGKVEIKKQVNEGDIVVFYTDREIENIIDNMTRNVMRMTMNGLRQYAATRIVQEYATRNEKGKIMTFPKAEPDKGRFNFIVDGKRVVVEIKDPLVAEAISGMETLGLTMWKPLAAAANLTRRAITLSGTFQLKQVFKDAPTAALVTGVKRPDLLMGGVFKGFVTSLTNSDPAVQILRAAGIGGFHSPARTPEAEVKRQIGVINKNSYDYVIGALDHFGDSSDMAQRVATYKRVMAETGDEAQALYQAANVINFMRHGSGQVAQIVTKTVPFMNAYAQSIDVLFQSLAGGGLKGVSRKRALARIGVTGSLLVGMTLLYCMAVGDDEEYQLLDDQSKLRSYVIPGTKIVLPMNTSAAYFFKAIPEMIYNYVMKNGTEKPMDEKRLRTGLKEAAVDMLLGPNPVPSAVKPFVEIALNKNFFTGETVIPRGMEKLETAEQYSASTSEAGKFLSSMTGGKEKRLLSPVEADHLIRSLFGTAGSMAQWASNVIGEAADARPAVVAKDYPFIGPFLRPEVPRGPEDLFYDFKEYTDKKYQTYMRLLERDRLDEAEEYLKKNEGLIAFSEYANETESSLKEINALIRMYGETTDKTLSPKEKRAEIENLQRIKNEILDNIEFIRKEAGM